MNGVSNLIKADKIIRWGMLIAFILLFLEAGILALFYLKLPPVIPLFNQMPWGTSRLGLTYAILLPLIITGVFFLCNYFLIQKLYLAMPLVSRIIGATTLLAAFLSIIFVIRTLQLIL